MNQSSFWSFLMIVSLAHIRRTKVALDKTRPMVVPATTYICFWRTSKWSSSIGMAVKDTPCSIFRSEFNCATTTTAMGMPEGCFQGAPAAEQTFC